MPGRRSQATFSAAVQTRPSLLTVHACMLTLSGMIRLAHHAVEVDLSKTLASSCRGIAYQRLPRGQTAGGWARLLASCSWQTAEARPFLALCSAPSGLRTRLRQPGSAEVGMLCINMPHWYMTLRTTAGQHGRLSACFVSHPLHLYCAGSSSRPATQQQSSQPQRSMPGWEEQLRQWVATGQWPHLEMIDCLLLALL